MRAILTYHSVDDSGSDISVPEEVFRTHARWLAASPIRVISLTEILRDIEGGEEERDGNAVAVTFDDGFRNFADTAWPILRDHGLPVTLFVVTDRAGGVNEWEPSTRVPRLPLLGWDELARLAEEGVTLGSHTRRHRRLDRVTGERLVDEVHGSAELIEARTGREPAALAYPYGAHDREARRRTAERYPIACTTRHRPLRQGEDPMRVPRLDAYYFRRPGRLEAWGTVRFRGRLRLRSAARRARRLWRAG